MRKPLAALALLCTLTFGSISAQQAPAFNRFELFTVLEVYLESLRHQTGIPGMSAAIVKDGEILWERGFGYQDVGARLRATPDTPYLVADMSATMSAVLLLQCVEGRKLRLDESVSRYGVDLPEGVTLRQLLSHTSVEGPGDTFLYNPERYTLLTKVMEHCAPQPYRKSVTHRILNHLIMLDSAPGTDLVDPDLELPEGVFTEAELQRYRGVLQRMAVPYRVDSRGRAERSPLPIVPMNAAGGLVTTVRDLAQFEEAIAPPVIPDLDPDLQIRPLLLPETRELAWTPAVNRAGVPVPMGLGWFVQYHRGQRVVWHFGSVPNAYSSLLIRLPAYDFTFVLLANSDRLTTPYNLHQGDVTRSVFGALFLRLFT